MAASTTPFADEPEYGYMWWLLGEGRYTASGIFGQKIVVIPDKRLVIGVHSNAISAVGSDYARHLNAALAALVDAVAAP
jgi:CubicO group peptidase (beta-lactamase class C family)